MKLKRKGYKTPLDIMPKYDADVEWYLGMFYYLSNSRKIFYSPQFIEISEMSALANNIGIIGSFEEFVSVIQSADHRYLQLIKDSQDKYPKTEEPDK